MKNVYEDIRSMIGNTPILKINHMGVKPGVNIYAKLELMNPAGSVKDRVGVYMIDDAKKRGILKEGGTIVTDDREINPMPVLTGAATYPHEAIEQLKAVVPNVIVVEAAKVAEELGNMKAQNIVLLGALVKQLGLDEVDWRDLVAKNVPAKTVDLNLAAFEKGYTM